MSQHKVFSTAQVSSSDQCSYWREVVQRNFGNLQFQPLDAGSFNGRIDALEDRGLLMRHLVAGQHKAVSSGQSSSPFIKVLMQLRGTCRHVCHNRETSLIDGDWMVYDALENEDHMIENHGDVDQLVFLIPRVQFRLFELRQSGSSVFRFGGQDPVSRLLFRGIVGRTFEGTFDERAVIDTMRLAVRLVPMALYEATGRSVVTIPQHANALADRIKKYVDSHLLDTFLTISDIGKAFACSKRALHIAFEGESETLSEYLWRRRLERTRDDLVNPGMQNHSITDIAFSWGFTSSAHFSRSFSRVFGQSPSTYRRRALNTAQLTGMAAAS